jgi:hypothetical protein
LNRHVFIDNSEKETITFARMTIEDLGLSRSEALGNPKTSEIMDRDLLRKMGLKLCKPCDVLLLALKTKLRIEHEWHHIIHEPITDSFGTPSILSFALDGFGLRIDSSKADEHRKWSCKNCEDQKKQYLFFRLMT